MFPRATIGPHSRASFGSESDGPFAGTSGSATYKIIPPVKTKKPSSSNDKKSKRQSRNGTKRQKASSRRGKKRTSQPNSPSPATTKQTSAAPETQAAATVASTTQISGAPLALSSIATVASPSLTDKSRSGDKSPRVSSPNMPIPTSSLASTTEPSKDAGLGNHLSPPSPSTPRKSPSNKRRSAGKKPHIYSIPPGSVIELSWANPLSKRAKFDCRLLSSKTTRYGVTYEHKPGKSNSPSIFTTSGDFHEVSFIFCQKKRVFQRFSRSSRRLLSQSNVVESQPRPTE